MLWWYITHCAHNTCNINMTNAVLTETFNYGTERRWCCGGILLIVRTTPTTKYDKCSSNRNLQLWNWETAMLWWYITHCAHNTCNINMTNAVLTETFNYGTERRWCCGGILLIVRTTPATKYDKCSSNRNLQLWNWETVMLWWYITHCAHNTCNKIWQMQF